MPQLWFQRSRLSSVRTLPERSGFKGIGREAEVHEDVLQNGGLHRARLGSERSHPCRSVHRHRKLSTASSPSSYKVWRAEEDEEVDNNGYVLPASPDMTERGNLKADTHFCWHSDILLLSKNSYSFARVTI